jgi:hypothetical protein
MIADEYRRPCVRMHGWKHRSTDMIGDEVARDLPQVNACDDFGVESDESVSTERTNIARVLVGLKIELRPVAQAQHIVGADRLRE